MRATGNAMIAPVVGSAGAAALTSTMLGVGIALVVKDIVKITIGSSEGRLLPVVRAVVPTYSCNPHGERHCNCKPT